MEEMPELAEKNSNVDISAHNSLMKSIAVVETKFKTAFAIDYVNSYFQHIFFCTKFIFTF